MKKLSYSLLIALFSMSAIFAQPMMNRNGNFGGQNPLLKNKLNLTAQQEKQFDNIIYNQRKTAIDTRAEIQKLRLELQKMMNNNNISENKLLTLTEKISDLRTKMSKDRITTWYKIYNILDSNQKVIWTNVMNRFTQHGKRGMMRKGGMRFQRNNFPNISNKMMMMK